MKTVFVHFLYSVLGVLLGMYIGGPIASTVILDRQFQPPGIIQVGRFFKKRHPKPECHDKDPREFFDFASQATTETQLIAVRKDAASCSEGYRLFLWGAVENESLSDGFVLHSIMAGTFNLAGWTQETLEIQDILKYGVANGRWKGASIPLFNEKLKGPEIIDEFPNDLASRKFNL